MRNQDPGWVIPQARYAPQHSRHYETIFTLANGYLGVRGSSEEGAKGESPGSYLAGVFDHAADGPTELPNIARWIGVRLFANGLAVTPEAGRLLSYVRYLDMKRAVLVREFRVKTRSGVTRVRVERFASRANPHSAAIRLQVTPENYSGRLTICADLDADVTNSGRKHLRVLRASPFHLGEQSDRTGAALETETLQSGIRIAQTFSTQYRAQDGNIEATRSIKVSNSGITEEVSFEVEQGREYTFDKLVNFFTSRDGFRDAFDVAVHWARSLNSGGYGVALADHEAAWDQIWNHCDVRIDGDPRAQQAIRFSIYHSAACAPQFSDKVSLAAKGLHGEGYRGHVFWDCEIFNLPMFVYAQPELAKNLLMYRYHTLDGARRKARSAGYKGALYAWESADTGDETTPRWVGNDGERVRIWCGEIEQHISADIAYAVWQYYRTTGDEEFLIRYGAEIIFETARFWVSRLEYNEVHERYEIRGVIGPDEYHEHVDNNVFTNAMAGWNIRLALDLADCLREQHPDRWVELADKLKLSNRRLQVWQRVARNVYLPYSEELRIHEQFDGFLSLERIDISRFQDGSKPLDVILGRRRTAGSQVVKQADVLMLMHLLTNEFPASVVESNFDYYADICVHGSSLSPSVHSIVASRLGRSETALAYFRQSSEIDLGDRMGNTDSGIHLASLGGNWQAVIFGFCGVAADESALEFTPRLPSAFNSVSFSVFYRGTPVRATVTRDCLLIDLTESEAGFNLPVRINGAPRLVGSGNTHHIRLEGNYPSESPGCLHEGDPVPDYGF